MYRIRGGDKRESDQKPISSVSALSIRELRPLLRLKFVTVTDFMGNTGAGCGLSLDVARVDAFYVLNKTAPRQY
jgi:hypothetical protein